jgi:hypothetical protein
MAIIYSYPSAQVELSDLIIGTKTTERGKATKSFLVSDLVYLINTAVAPTLQQVTTNGNTTTNNIYAPKYYIYDDTLGDYGSISINNDLFRVKGAPTNEYNILSVSSEGYINFKKNLYDLRFDATAVTTDRTWVLPNASGTVALQTAASGSFTASGKTITVVNGIITSIV